MWQGDFSLKTIERAVRLSVPFFVLALLLMINLAPLPFSLPYTEGGKPQLVLIFIYYWAIYRPTLVPPALCFVIGLVMDILSGVPLGLNALVLLTVQWLVQDQRRFLMGQPYGVIWAMFGILAVLISCVQWGLYGLPRFDWVEIVPFLLGAAGSVMLFPFISLMLLAVHRILPAPARGYS